MAKGRGRKGGMGGEARQEEEGGQGAEQQEHEDHQIPDPPAARLAIHPTGAAVAIAVGQELRVYIASSQETRTLVSKAEGQKGLEHCVRSVAFNASGTHLLSGSDDKAATLWDCASWQRVQEMRGGKKVTSVAFSRDGAHLLAADKFGDVYVTKVQPAAEPGAPPAAAAGTLLLGHYCSIMTSLSLSRSGRLLATTDRDKRARVSRLPGDPCQGAAAIESICFGHTSFVTCSTFLQHGDEELLATGGGDGTVRIWDPLSGKLLSTLQVCAAPEAEEAASSSAEPGDSQPAAGIPSVLALAASGDGKWLAVVAEGRDEVGVAAVDWASSSLQGCAWSALGGLYLPTAAAFDASDRLWLVGGPPTETSTTVSLACATVAAGGELAAVPDFLPAEARAALEARDGSEGTAMEAAQKRRQVSSHLRKRVYTKEEQEAHRTKRQKELAAK